jgi:hypothetical protein
MRFRSIRRSVSTWGNSQSVAQSLLAFGIGWAATFVPGCAPGVIGSDPTETVTNEEALVAVQMCQAQARTCVSSGTGSSCEDDLRACLSSSLPAGAPADHPTRDAGHPDPDDDDAEPPDPANRDAGRPLLPDAAANALTRPVGSAEAGAAALSCVNALRTCLASPAKPSTCAETARQCLSGMRDGGRH